MACMEHCGLPAESGRQPFRLQGLWTQFEDQRTHLSQGGLGLGEDVAEGFSYLAGITVEEGASGMSTKRDAVEGLRDRIVQLTCQALPLFQDCQRLGLFVEPSVFYRYRRLVGNSHSHPCMACGEV